MFQLLFTLCVISCTDTPVNRPYSTLEACQYAAVVEENKALIDIQKSKQLNIKVKFECKQI